eukprot:TRINITY_DN10456_c0_g1_i1.p1 TRINITY_DN10456_c0_g1~~TRINITY_DN10456_c0_g1_i1.p1  ORF type:complete len:427 (+),score=83.91 TRINITY_DN10456_c0_g1_i1:32-1282(+)
MAEDGAADEDWEICIAPFHLSTKRFYFWTQWQPTAFRLKITDGTNVWHGEVTEEYISTVLLKDVNMDVEQFVRRTREGLTLEDGARKRFEYYLKSLDSSGNHRMKFVWVFPIDDAAPLIQLRGEMNMERIKDAKPIIQGLVDHLLQEKDAIQQQRDEVTRINEHLRQQQKVLTSNLDKLRADKELMHAELISKFVELLNEKKKKIRSLKEELLKRPERAKPGDKDDDDDAVPQQQNDPRRRAPEPAPVAASLQFGTLSMGQSQPSSSLDLLAVSPDHVVRPTVRKRQRMEPDASETAMDLQSAASTPKRPKLNPAPSPPAASSKPPVAPLKMPQPLTRAPKHMIVDDEGSAPPQRAVGPAPIVSYGSPNPSPSYGENRNRAAAGTINRGGVISSGRGIRSIPKEQEDAGDLFHQIE